MENTTVLCHQERTVYRLPVNRESNKAAVNNAVSLHAPIHFSIFICALQNLLQVISVITMDMLLGCVIQN